jgi:hypothetical protein
LQKFPKSENRRGILPRNILKINDLSGKMPDLFAAKFDFCKSLICFIISRAHNFCTILWTLRPRSHPYRIARIGFELKDG